MLLPTHQKQALPPKIIAFLGIGQPANRIQFFNVQVLRWRCYRVSEKEDPRRPRSGHADCHGEGLSKL